MTSQLSDWWQTIRRWFSVRAGNGASEEGDTALLRPSQWATRYALATQLLQKYPEELLQVRQGAGPDTTDPLLIITSWPWCSEGGVLDSGQAEQVVELCELVVDRLFDADGSSPDPLLTRQVCLLYTRAIQRGAVLRPESYRTVVLAEWRATLTAPGEHPLTPEVSPALVWLSTQLEDLQLYGWLIEVNPAQLYLDSTWDNRQLVPHTREVWLTRMEELLQATDPEAVDSWWQGLAEPARLRVYAFRPAVLLYLAEEWLPPLVLADHGLPWMWEARRRLPHHSEEIWPRLTTAVQEEAMTLPHWWRVAGQTGDLRLWQAMTPGCLQDQLFRLVEGGHRETWIEIAIDLSVEFLQGHYLRQVTYHGSREADLWFASRPDACPTPGAEGMSTHRAVLFQLWQEFQYADLADSDEEDDEGEEVVGLREDQVRVGQWLADYVEDYQLLEVDLVDQFRDTLFAHPELVTMMWPGRCCVEQDSRYCYIRCQRSPGPTWRQHPEDPQIWYHVEGVRRRLPRLDLCQPPTRAKSARSG